MILGMVLFRASWWEKATGLVMFLLRVVIFRASWWEKATGMVMFRLRVVIFRMTRWEPTPRMRFLGRRPRTMMRFASRTRASSRNITGCSHPRQRPSGHASRSNSYQSGDKDCWRAHIEESDLRKVNWRSESDRHNPESKRVYFGQWERKRKLPTEDWTDEIRWTDELGINEKQREINDVILIQHEKLSKDHHGHGLVFPMLERVIGPNKTNHQQYEPQFTKDKRGQQRKLCARRWYLLVHGLFSFASSITKSAANNRSWADTGWLETSRTVRSILRLCNNNNNAARKESHLCTVRRPWPSGHGGHCRVVWLCCGQEMSLKRFYLLKKVQTNEAKWDFGGSIRGILPCRLPCWF